MSPSLESAEQDYDTGAFLTVISVEVNELLKGITARYITSEKKSRSKKVPIKHKEKVLIFKILLGQNDRTRYDKKKIDKRTSSHRDIFHRNNDFNTILNNKIEENKEKQFPSRRGSHQ